MHKDGEQVRGYQRLREASREKGICGHEMIAAGNRALDLCIFWTDLESNLLLILLP